MRNLEKYPRERTSESNQQERRAEKKEMTWLWDWEESESIEMSNRWMQ